MIKKWVLKAIVQKVISFLPMKHQINFLFQKYVTRGVYLGEQYFEDKLVHFKHHWEAWQNHGNRSQSLHVLELGTGWYPVIPLLFYLKGVDNIITVDIAALMDADKVLVAINKILEANQYQQLESYTGVIDLDRLEKLKAIQDSNPTELSTLLAHLQIEYLITDARQLSLDDKSVDMVISNNVFEHIYPNILTDILKEFKRILAKGGVMSHFIDMTDHFAHLDKSISVYHFLQFSEKQWAWIDNSVQPQSRLRFPQYVQLYNQMDIPIADTVNASDDIESLKKVNIAEEFKHMSLEELGIVHSYVVSRD